MKLDEVMKQYSEFLSKDQHGLNVDVPDNCDWAFVEFKMKIIDGRVLVNGMFIDGKEQNNGTT